MLSPAGSAGLIWLLWPGPHRYSVLEMKGLWLLLLRTLLKMCLTFLVYKQLHRRRESLVWVVFTSTHLFPTAPKMTMLLPWEGKDPKLRVSDGVNGDSEVRKNRIRQQGSVGRDQDREWWEIQKAAHGLALRTQCVPGAQDGYHILHNLPAPTFSRPCWLLCNFVLSCLTLNHEHNRVLKYNTLAL